MREESNGDLGPAALLVATGLVVPVVVAGVARDTVQLYLTGLEVTAATAVAFAVVWWLAIEARDLERIDVAIASVLVPALFFLAVIVLAVVEVLPVGPRSYLFDGLAGLFRYASLFAGAGLAAVALSRRLGDHDRLPGPRTLAAGLAVVVVLGGALAVGVNHAAASSATVTAVEPGTLDHDRALNVTVEGAPAELRVAVVAPGGQTVWKRLSRGEMSGGSGTVSIPAWFDETPPPDTLPIRAGGYEVRVTSLLGATVATDRYAVDGEVTPTVTEVRASVGPIDWANPPKATIHDRPVEETRIGVAVANEAPFPAEYDLRLRYDGPGPTPEVHTDLQPGDEVGLVLDLPPAALEHVRTEQGSRATVVLSRSQEPVLVRRVTLPAE